MRRLHIVQGGNENGDKAWLERAAPNSLNAPRWVVPKTCAVGDDVVIYIQGVGFFATARICSLPKPHPHWPNRYGAGLSAIKLIKPPISLASIRRHIPNLTWTVYPRSVTTPSSDIADQVRDLIRTRRNGGVPDLDDAALGEATLDELRAVALAKARPSATPKERKTIFRAASRAIHRYVILRSNGQCEACHSLAPFRKADDSPYLEPHHTTRLADEGPDHPAHVIALCPNCHRRAHSSKGAKAFNRSLKKRLTKLEPR